MFFFIIVESNPAYSVGFRVRLVFQLTQHKIDEQLLSSFVKLLECGNLYKDGEAFNYRVTRFKDIVHKIIPFFREYKILGVKSQDFADWCQVAELIKEKKHLMEEGLKEIRRIKAGMNKNRK